MTQNSKYINSTDLNNLVQEMKSLEAEYENGNQHFLLFKLFINQLF